MNGNKHTPLMSNRKPSMDETIPRTIRVVEPENHTGPIEYKRQIHHASASRLRSLTTQLSYRLDQGTNANATCEYLLGVEDDGCHSLLDYASVAESARILECLARTLNAVVVERTVVQNEVILGDNNQPKSNPDPSSIITVQEPSLFVTTGDASSNNGKQAQSSSSSPSLLDTAPGGAFTRITMRIRRVETHLLDERSLQELSELTKNINIHDDKERLERLRTVTAETIAERTEDSVSDTLSLRNIRVAVVGNVDAGKSTLIGTLTTSSLDDGRGRSRTMIMTHRHEIESGRTSTVSSHLMGFKHTGEPVTASVAAGRSGVGKRKSESDVARESHRVITLLDLAGHEKYLKTTIHGVSSGFADHSLILVNSRHPPTHMTQHHLNLCCSFGIPTIVVFTKIDGCPEHAFKTSKMEVEKMLRSPEIRKKPFMIRNEADVTTVLDKLHILAPMIETSCVTGAGISLLQKLLFSLPKRRRHEKKAVRSFEFLVEDIFNVPGVGSVVSGFVNAGQLTVGSNSHVLIGPTDDGSFMKTVAKSAHIARIHTPHVTAGQSACLALALNKDLRKKLRRGMVVLQASAEGGSNTNGDGISNTNNATKQFEAEICVLKGEGTTIRRSYQAYVHILNVRQSAYARHIELIHQSTPSPMTATRDIDEPNAIVLRPGCRAKVRFEFAKRPEYVRPGMRMLFRDGRVRGVGIITAIPDHGDKWEPLIAAPVPAARKNTGQGKNSNKNGNRTVSVN